MAGLNIGDAVRIVTDRPLATWLRGNVRQRRPGLHLKASSYQGVRGFVCARVGGSRYEVTFYAPAELPHLDVREGMQVPWFPDGVPRPARLVVHDVTADDLDADPSPAESWEQFWDRQGEIGRAHV